MTALTRDLVDFVGAAFNANDVEAVMTHFAPDAVFDHAVGPEEHGLRFEGTEAIRAVFAGLFETVERVRWEPMDCAIAGERAYCTYLRQAKRPDGTEEAFLSVDILTYRDGLIVHKDTYYKQRTG